MKVPALRSTPLIVLCLTMSGLLQGEVLRDERVVGLSSGTEEDFQSALTGVAARYLHVELIYPATNLEDIDATHWSYKVEYQLNPGSGGTAQAVGELSIGRDADQDSYRVVRRHKQSTELNLAKCEVSGGEYYRKPRTRIHRPLASSCASDSRPRHT